MAAVTLSCASLLGSATSVKLSSSFSAKNVQSRKLSLAFRAAASKAEVEDLPAKIEEAKEICETGTKEECAVAWDEVEEISAEKAHAKVKAKNNSDPLEKFCEENPETDECRTYED